MKFFKTHYSLAQYSILYTTLVVLLFRMIFVLFLSWFPTEMNIQYIEAAKKLIHSEPMRFPLLYPWLLATLFQLGITWHTSLSCIYIVSHVFMWISFAYISSRILKVRNPAFLWIAAFAFIVIPYLSGTMAWENLSTVLGSALLWSMIALLVKLKKSEWSVQIIFIILLIVLLSLLCGMVRLEIFMGVLCVCFIAFIFFIRSRISAKVSRIPLRFLGIIFLILFACLGGRFLDKQYKNAYFPESYKELESYYLYISFVAGISPSQCYENEPCSRGGDRLQGGMRRFGSFEENQKSFINVLLNHPREVVAKMLYTTWDMLVEKYPSSTAFGWLGLVFFVLGLIRLLQARIIKQAIVHPITIPIVLLFGLMQMGLSLLPPQKYVHISVLMGWYLIICLGAYALFVEWIPWRWVSLLLIGLLIGYSLIHTYFFKYPDTISSPLHLQAAQYLNTQCKNTTCMTNVLPRATLAWLDFDPYPLEDYSGDIDFRDSYTNQDIHSHGLSNQSPCNFIQRMNTFLTSTGYQDIYYIHYTLNQKASFNQSPCIGSIGGQELQIQDGICGTVVSETLFTKVASLSYEDDNVCIYKYISNQ